MPKPRSEAGFRTSPQKPDSPAGGFNPDGSWNQHMGGHDDLTQFVWSLCRARRAAKLSPAELVPRIQGSGFAGAFQRELPFWQDMIRWEDWPHAFAWSSAASVVKYQGRSPGAHWHGGEHVGGRWESCETCKAVRTGEVPEVAL